MDSSSREAAGAEDEIREVVRAELRAIRREERRYLGDVARAAAMLAAAFLLLYLGAVFVTLMAVYILGALIEPWIGAAIVGSTILVAAGFVSRRLWRAARETLRRGGSLD